MTRKGIAYCMFFCSGFELDWAIGHLSWKVGAMAMLMLGIVIAGESSSKEESSPKGDK